MSRKAIRMLGMSMAAVAAISATAVAVRADQHKGAVAPADTRESIVLNASERAQLLAGMRTYLESVQQIVEALATNKSILVAQSARQSGTKMLQEVSPTLAMKVPVGFTAMGLNTHEKFDALADSALKSASRSEILTSLNEILGNCTSCHATYRAVPATP